MSEPTRFSIVIPAYNSEAFIGGVVRSCLGQTVSDLEVIVVDDGSSDGTAAIVEEISGSDGRLSLIRQRNAGGAAARNRGAEAASAGFLTFNDADDLLMPRYLETVWRGLSASPDAGFAYTGIWALDDRPRRIQRVPALPRFAPPHDLPPTIDSLMSAMIEENFITGSRTIRRSAFEETGGYDASFRFVEDYDLWLRMIARGWKPLRVPERLTVLRDRVDAEHTDVPSMLSTLAAVLGKVATDEAASPEVRDWPSFGGQSTRTPLQTSPGQCSERLGPPEPGLGRARRRLRPSAFWYDEPPAEITEAFGDLESL